MTVFSIFVCYKPFDDRPSQNGRERPEFLFGYRPRLVNIFSGQPNHEGIHRFLCKLFHPRIITSHYSVKHLGLFVKGFL